MILLLLIVMTMTSSKILRMFDVIDDGQVETSPACLYGEEVQAVLPLPRTAVH